MLRVLSLALGRFGREEALPVRGTTLAFASAPMARARLPHLLLVTPCLLLGCTGGGGRAAGTTPSSEFVAIVSEPGPGAQLYLNDAFSVDFTSVLDPASLTAETFAFTVLDAKGRELTETPLGTYTIGKASGDAVPGRRVTFEPQLPLPGSGPGLLPGRRYVVTVRGGDEAGPLRDEFGRGLGATFRSEFTTVEGSAPRELYRDSRKGGPARTGFAFTPRVGEHAALSLLGRPPLEVRLSFDQPLRADASNLPRGRGERGRVWLEYDDPEPSRGPSTWIPTSLELAENASRGAVLVLRPLGVLPNHATVRVVVSAALEDLTGESNAGRADYDPWFGTFTTEPGYEPRFDAIVARFDASELVDREAAFPEPRAEIGAGFVRASLDFANGAPQHDFEPSLREVILNTDSTQILPKYGPPLRVEGGVFAFRNVTIPAGVVVRGSGSRPMVWLVSGDMRIDGELTVSGGDGGSAVYLTQYRGPGDIIVGSQGDARTSIRGGLGVCGGGDGGRGSAYANGPLRTTTEAGFGPGRAADQGGAGGRMSCTSSCGRGSGGGGGSFATKGDPGYKVVRVSQTGTGFVQVEGRGGQGCTGSSGATSRSLAGGAAGALVFRDARRDDDFWGSGFDVRRQMRIVGELVTPRGGNGGGGGGDATLANCDAPFPPWAQLNKGGGGGAGGGVLVIQALGTIEIGPGGRVRADGGHGGGGEQMGSNNAGAGGGGGSGGMVVLMAGRKIRLHTHGGTYSEDDFSFSVSADGGVSTQSEFGATPITGKYATLHAAGTWDATPTGGFGGLGLIQLMAPSGTNADGTNTILDDAIEFVRDGSTVLTGAEKMRYLSWPGFPNEQGVLVDDHGQPTNLARAAGGDLRPHPMLLPAPFGPRSKVRSRWIDLGAVARRELPAPDDGPRGVVPVESGGERLGAGPVFAFEGTIGAGDAREGFLDYVGSATALLPRVRTLVPRTPLAELEPNASFEGRPAYALTLASPTLGALRDRYAGASCELCESAGSALARFRILGHDAARLWLAPEGMLPARARVTTVQIVGECVDFATGGGRGFGPPRALARGGYAPPSNLRVGFAFHADPSRAHTSGSDPLRFPPEVGTYVHDLADPAVVAAVRTRPFVHFEVLFDLLFAESLGAQEPRQLSPSLPRPELRALVVPYRF